MNCQLKIEYAKQVIVEGQDEVRVFRSIAKHLSISDIQVHECGGYPKLRSFLKTFKGLSGFGLVRSLAVVADANSSRTDREQGIRNTLHAMDLPIPSRPLEVASGPDLKVAYLVVPHSRDTGMIEDVCLDSVKTDPAIECVEHYFECIRQTRLSGPKQVRMSKARIHAFLASRERPELRLGEAAEKGTWPFSTEAFHPLKELLRML